MELRKRWRVGEIGHHHLLGVSCDTMLICYIQGSHHYSFTYRCNTLISYTFYLRIRKQHAHNLIHTRNTGMRIENTHLVFMCVDEVVGVLFPDA